MKEQKEFLEPEVRDGFYVPSEMKQAWASEMDVLKEIDRICRKYHLSYFADWGTLLGVVRHGGYIPWDDDLDITMKRADYEKFRIVAPQELPDGFAVYTYDTHPDFRCFLMRVVGKTRICFEEEHLKKFHGFPYIVGVDIFVLDYVAEDERQEEERDTLARYVIAVADQIEDGQLKESKEEKILTQIEEMFQIQIGNREDKHALRIELYRLAEKLFAMIPENQARELTRMMPDGIYGNKNLRLPKEYYDRPIWLPFETILMPVPAAYDEMLRKRYGDYMRLVRNCGGHDYPFFEIQRKQLQAVLDFDMPGYRYTGIWERNEEQGRSHSLKYIAQESLGALKQDFGKLIGTRETNMELLQEIQQLAIDLGTKIETCKGEGNPVVTILEQYCEAVFELSKGYDPDVLNKMEKMLAELEQSIRINITERKEIVILPYKASQWNFIRNIWRAAMEDEHCDVNVVPIPYYYKEYDGTLCDMQYERDRFPEEVQITGYEDYDFELHYPEAIFIQNPYDEWNPAISVKPFFYSVNMKSYTEKLIYIPPFVLEEFDADSYREYFNMKYYCTVPGVVNADQVIVQSENMKKLYVKKLTEFAGENTKEIWEKKITVTGSILEDGRRGLSKDDNMFPQEWRAAVTKRDGTQKKVILYYIGVSSMVQYGKQMIAKMKDVIRIFGQYRESVIMLWKPQKILEETIKQMNHELYQQYYEFMQIFKEQDIGIMDQSENDDMAVAFSDAYYGDSSPLVQKFRNAEKPVMIQDCFLLGEPKET